jgi:methylated-DNA-[protein]-cysteine S-methyltransferase
VKVVERDDGYRFVEILSGYGTIILVWREGVERPVQRIFLSSGESETAAEAFPRARSGSNPAIDSLRSDMERFLAGEPVTLDAGLCDLEQCNPFQRRVLLAEHAIPRGWVSTYGKIARHIGAPGAARAVGTALGRNPFPIVVPCHRAVRANGALGGFRGGLGMKRRLLEGEGVRFDAKGRVYMERVHYR